MTEAMRIRPVMRRGVIGAAAILGAALLAGSCIAQEGASTIDVDRPLTEAEEKFTGRLAGIEESFSGLIQELWQKFLRRMEMLEGEFGRTAMALEKAPGDAGLLAKIEELQKKLDELGADVQRLRETAVFAGAAQ